MVIITQPEPGGCTIRLKGDLDACSSLAVYHELEEACKAGRKYIKINCQELNYISSAGLGVFMSHLPHFKQSGTTLVLYHLNSKIKNVFKILGIDNLISIVKTAQDAQAYIDHHNLGIRPPDPGKSA